MAEESTVASLNESVRQHFESAWRAGGAVQIEDYIPAADDPHFLPTLEELVHIELEMKWKAHHHSDSTVIPMVTVQRVEDYLVRFPQLNQPTIVLRLLKQEFRVRHRYGDCPATGEYYGRFPELVVNGAAFEVPAGTPSDALPTIQGYEILELLGRGGMGVVYKARQVELKRIVALKMIRLGAQASDEELIRFRTEAEAVAHLQHPNIVQIHEVGQKNGQPYFSLEYVEGGSLDRRLAGVPQSAEFAADLVERLARVIHFAHSRGIIHRDLKPANILLSGASSSLIPKITDFGLAKRLQADAGQTETGAILGTPSYMAPEQADGAKAIGPAADVYALGAILYEMLTGRPPFRGPTALDTIMQVVHEEPVPPTRLQPRLPRDLETICLVCLRKEPAKRYASAEALADDLRRFLRNEPIAARPVAAWERILKLSQRRPMVTGLIALVVLVAFVGLAGILWQWQQAESNYTLAETRAGAESRARKEESIARGAEAAALKAAKKALLEADTQLYYHRIALADREWHDINIAAADRLLEACPNHLRHWEWWLLKWRCNAHQWSIPRHHSLWAAYSPNGKQLACGSFEIEIRAADTGLLLRTLANPAGGANPCAAYSPDGRFLAAGYGEKHVIIWDPDTGAKLHQLDGLDDWVNALAFSPDGKQLAAASGLLNTRGQLKLWDSSTWKEIRTQAGHRSKITSVAFSPNSRQLATACWGGAAKVWDSDTGKQLHAFDAQPHAIASLAYGPDGKSLAAGLGNGTITIWDTEKGTHVGNLIGHRAMVRSLAVNAEDQRLASASEDKLIGIWNWQTGQSLSTLRGHTQMVQGVAFSPDGKRLASAGGDVKVWDSTTNQAGNQLFATDVQTFAFSSNGKRLATADQKNAITVWDVAARRSLAKLVGHAGTVVDLAFSPDDRWLASASLDCSVKIWDLAEQKSVLSFTGHAEAGVGSVAFSPNGEWVASAAPELWKALPGEPRFKIVPADVKVWETHTGKIIRCWTLERGISVRKVAFGAASERLAIACNQTGGVPGGAVRILDVSSDKELFVFAQHHDSVESLAFDPVQKIFATASRDKTLKICAEANGNEQFTLIGHPTAVLAVDFSGDGRRVASADHDGFLKLWDPATGVEIFQLRFPDQQFEQVRFSPDGTALAALGRNRHRPAECALWLWQILKAPSEGQ